MEAMQNLLSQLSGLLISLGVPSEQGQLFALLAVYGLVILAVLVVVVWVLRAKRRARGVEEEVAAPVAVEPVSEPDTVAQPPEEGEAQTATLSPLERLRDGLARTSTSLVGRIDTLLRGEAVIDAELLEELEEILITADVGVQTTTAIVAALEQRLGRDELQDAASLRQALQEEVRSRLQGGTLEPDGGDAPFVVMVVGVNGVGKTTTIGKLAYQWQQQGRKVLLGAGDTFRAAAADQLEIWGGRAGVDVVRHAEGGDPAAVAFDAAKAAAARKVDVLLLDTAGRLHTKTNLMEELKKVRRVLEREIPGAPHAVLLVLDATTGQNAVNQARQFNEAVKITGVALTKLDGTAKGGVVAALGGELGLPVCFIGIGERAEDLRAFDADEFVAALFASKPSD